MANYRAAARQAAKRYGLDPGVFVRQINAESGFDPNARSGAGAIGIAQIMPRTAAGWGVNPSDPIASLNAAAKNMAKYVRAYGYEGALRAYNAGPGAIQASKGYAETNAYVAKILGGSNPGKLSKPTGGSSGGGGGSPARVGFSPGDAVNVAQLLSTLRGQTARPQVAVTPPTAPSFSASVALPKGYQQAPAAVSDRGVEKPDYAAALTALSAQASSGSTVQAGTSGGGGAGTKKGPAVGPKGLPKGTANFEGKTVASWIKPALIYARQQGWKGQVVSGFRSFAEQTRIYNSGVRPAAVPGHSHHEGSDFPRGAVDVSDSASLSAILRRSPYRKLLQWAGSKDPPHFSHPYGGGY